MLSAAAEIEAKNINLADIPKGANTIILGNKNAKNFAYILTDPECPICVKFHKESLNKVIAKRKDIAFKILLYPLEMHKTAKQKSIDIIKSKDKIKALESAYNKKAVSKTPGSDAEAIAIVDANISFAKKNNIHGTPTIIFQDGSIKLSGMDPDGLINKMDSVFKSTKK